MNINKAVRACSESFFSVDPSKRSVFFKNKKTMMLDVINFQKMSVLNCSWHVLHVVSNFRFLFLKNEEKTEK